MNVKKRVDLSDCAKEPIHIPGSIQAHGVFLATDFKFCITHYSQNYKLLFDNDHLDGAQLSHVGGELLEREIENFFNASRPEKYLLTDIQVRGKLLPTLVHLTPSGYIVETGLYELPDERSAALLKSVNHVLAVIAESSDLDTLFSRVTEELRHFLRIDRVMLYEFDDQWNGEVKSESKAAALESFLGLHFPSTDIPEQARLLYTRNWLRTIPDVNYEPVEIIPPCGPGTARPLDLSDSVLRSISPIHIEYLKNMGVSGTVVMSLIVNGKLWGLVACHHYQKHHLSLEERYLCEMFAKILSSNIQRLLELKRNNYIRERQSILHRMNLNILKMRSMAKALVESEPLLTELLPCDGAAVVNGDEISSIGLAPGREFIANLITWLEQRHTFDIFYTHRLPDQYMLGQDPYAIGLLSLRLAKNSKSFLLWFRKERIHHLNWAGDPHNKVLIDPATLKLSPRRSFALFKEAIQGESKPWNEYEVELVLSLRIYILEFMSYEKTRLESMVNEKTKQLAVALKTAEESRELAEQTAALKSHVLESMSHEIRTPLNGIMGITHALKAQLKDHTATQYIDLIEKSSARLLQTLTSILELAELEANKKKFQIQRCAVDELMQEVTEVMKPLAESKGLSMEFNKNGHTYISEGDPSMISQIFFNLISNAIKYTQSGGITVNLSEKKIDEIVYVSVNISDTGIGMSEEFMTRAFEPFTQESMGLSRNYEGVGLGLSITRKYIDMLGGLIMVESQKGKGTNFEILLPKILPS